MVLVKLESWVLQVNLIKGQSDTTLLDMWRFEARVSISGPMPGSVGLYRFRQEKRCYAIMAIVRCRNLPHTLEDHIRIFDEGDAEVLPDLDAQLTPFWPWRIHEPIPAGE